MVLSYNLIKQKRRQQQTNAPPLLAILMAMRRRLSYAYGIAWCSMSRATPEATGCCHWVTTCSICSRSRHGDSKQNNNVKCTHFLAILMAVAMRRYYISRITWWRRFMAFLKATKRHRQASTCSDNIYLTCLPPFFVVYFIAKSSKKATKQKDNP